ncbi:MAG: hypothetical protein U9R34_03965 [Nanoarchaeota archaeon]|nr:hypothetical protein [Nanoarchaeota archaeon]
MTKHVYEDSNLTGVVILGQYQDGDIREALRQFRDPFQLVKEQNNKWLYWDSINHEEKAPVGITITYEASHTQPEHILASTLGPTKFVNKRSLEGYLEEFLKVTGIKELDSRREQFVEEPFKGWEYISKQIRT